MSTTAVLLCRRVELAADGRWGVAAAAVDDLCERPDRAAAALRASGADRAALGLCDRRPSGELIVALRAAGAVAFGIESVALHGRSEHEAAALVAGAVARLGALEPGERGRRTAAAGAISRRALFSPRAVIDHRPVAVLDAAACLGRARCGLCAGICPERAIAVGERSATIDPTACTACGACVPRCPPGALRLSGSSTAQIEAQLDALLDDVSGIVLACASAAAVAPPGWALVELPTLALITPCPRGGGVPAHGRPIGLREPEATAAAAVLLAAPDAVPAFDAPASPLGRLDLDPERCTICGACAVACPTDALSLDDGCPADAPSLDDGRADAPSLESVLGASGLRHDPAACVGCGRCAAVCPESALTVRRGIDVERLRRGPFALARREHERCATCGAELAPRQLRRRANELLGRPDAPLELCSGCAARLRPQTRAPYRLG